MAAAAQRLLFARERIRRFGRLGVQERTVAERVPRAQRYCARLDVAVLTAAGTPIDAVLLDLSVSGFRAALPQVLPVGTVARMLFPGGRSKHFRVVRLDEEGFAGEFLSEFSPDEFDRALIPD